MHLVDDTGNIVGQWDGSGAAWEGWREQDELIQQHDIQLPDTMPPGTYQIWAGLYDPGTGQRWQIFSPSDSQQEGDNRFFLGELIVDVP